MTRDEIIRMAMDAFLLDKVDCSDDHFIRADAYIPEIERFAELVAAAEREQMQANGWRQCAVGQKTTQFCGMLEQAVAAERERLNKKIAALEADVDHFFKLSGEYLERANKAEEAVALERERCAKVCESLAYNSLMQKKQTWSVAANGCAKLIREMK